MIRTRTVFLRRWSTRGLILKHYGATATSMESSMDAAITAFLDNPAASGLLTQGSQLPVLW